MRLWKRPTCAAAVAALAGVLVLLFTPTSATAAGAGAVMHTPPFKDVTERFPFANPWRGSPGTGSILLLAGGHSRRWVGLSKEDR